MANSLAQLPWEPCVIEPRKDRAVEAFARRTQGVPNPTIGYFASVPWLARATCELHPRYGGAPIACVHTSKRTPASSSTCSRPARASRPRAWCNA
jgi:hypothetical protein